MTRIKNTIPKPNRKQKSRARTARYNKLQKMLKEINKYEGTEAMKAWNRDFYQHFGEKWDDDLTKEEAAEFKKQYLENYTASDGDFKPSITSYKTNIKLDKEASIRKGRITHRRKGVYLHHLHQLSEGLANEEYVEEYIDCMERWMPKHLYHEWGIFVQYLNANISNILQSTVKTGINLVYQYRDGKLDYQDWFDKTAELLGVIGEPVLTTQSPEN